MTQLLVCAHQGSGESGQLWYSLFDGSTNWSPDLQVPDTMMSASPALVELKGLLYCLHQGSGNSGELWINSWNQSYWLLSTIADA